jgi:hypothetical protein
MMTFKPLKRILRSAGVLIFPLMAANLINTDMPISETLFDPCSNEDVNLNGSAHLVGNGTLNNNTVHVIAQVDEHLVGTGVSSGATYRLNATAHAELNIDIDPVTNTGEETIPLAMTQLIGHGGVPNANVQLLVHFTVDANGNVTANVTHIRAACN